nr:hypothetical protein [Marinicella sp. W31]MDC2876552.1 hypothetical protein [Marinicella sp. W31]
MSYALITPAAEEPVTLAEVKDFCVLTAVTRMRCSAIFSPRRGTIWKRSAVSLVTQAWRLYRDDWPSSGMVSLARGPVQSVDTVTAYDGRGLASLVSLDHARLDGRARPARFCLPELAGRKAGMNGIEVDFTTGFGAAGDVPEVAKQAILRHVAHMFAFRGVVQSDLQPAATPDGYDLLIAPLKAWRL